MKAHPYFSHFIIPLFKYFYLFFFFNPRELENELEKNQAEINIHFQKSVFSL